MIYRVIIGIAAAGLFLAYMAPVVWRLQDVALWIVSGLSAVMMLVDLWQSLQTKDD